MGCSSINPWSNGKSCLLCLPKKRGFLVVFCASHRDGSSSTLLTGLHSDDVISRWFDFSRHLLSDLACQQGGSHQSQRWHHWQWCKSLRLAMWTRVSRLEHVKHCCPLLAFGSIAKAFWSTRFLTLRALLRAQCQSMFQKMILTDWWVSLGVSHGTMKRWKCCSQELIPSLHMLLHILPVVPLSMVAHLRQHPHHQMTNKRSHKPTATQPRLINAKLEHALMSGQDEDVAYTGVPTESDDTFALDCTDSLNLQKPCDPPSIIAPGDIVQAPRLIRGVATGSEESVQIVQATTPGWVVARLGLPGAKVRRATRDGAEGLIVGQPLRKPLQWSKWFGSRRHGIGAATEAAQCKATWDLEHSKAFLVRGDSSSIADSSELLYSLDKVRKCGELEVGGLLCGDSAEGRAECARRQSAANFNGRVQQCDGDGDENNVMESKSTEHLALPPQWHLWVQSYHLHHQSRPPFPFTHVTGAKAELFFCRNVEVHVVFSSMAWGFLCRKLGPTVSIQLWSQLLMVSMSL